MMRRILPVFYTLAFLIAAAAGVHAGEPGAVLDRYFAIHGRLASDSMDGVKGEATQLAREAKSLGAPGKAIAAAATELEQAATLEAARGAFARLSDAMIAWADATAEGDVTVMYCSMANKSWMQKEKDKSVKNPYYGKSMLGCGEIKSRKKAS